MSLFIKLKLSNVKGSKKIKKSYCFFEIESFLSY